MESIFDLEHPYIKPTSNAHSLRHRVSDDGGSNAAVFYCKKFKNQPRAFSAASTT